MSRRIFLRGTNRKMELVPCSTLNGVRVNYGHHFFVLMDPLNTELKIGLMGVYFLDPFPGSTKDRHLR